MALYGAREVAAADPALQLLAPWLELSLGFGGEVQIRDPVVFALRGTKASRRCRIEPPEDLPGVIARLLQGHAIHILPVGGDIGPRGETKPLDHAVVGPAAHHGAPHI